MKNQSKLKGKDLINIGIYAAIYCVIMTAVAMLGFIPIMMPMLCVLVPLIGGTPMMLFMTKVNKVIGKLIPNAPHETLLVIDATTGQNGIMQAKAFKEITNITGIVLTKLDGTAKGGIVLAIKEEVNIPVKFIGLGERMEDLKPFDIEAYIYGLFKDMM